MIPKIDLELGPDHSIVSEQVVVGDGPKPPYKKFMGQT